MKFDFREGELYFISGKLIQNIMIKSKIKHNRKLPLLIEKGQDGLYVVECPLFDGCYTQGKTIEEAIANIREVIEIILEEKNAKRILRNYDPQEISLHTITL